MTERGPHQTAASAVTRVHPHPKDRRDDAAPDPRRHERPSRIRTVGNVFKGGGGVDVGPIERLRDPVHAPDLSDASLVRGHLPFGIREYMPTTAPFGM